jgi:hypothetical protein
MSAIGRPDANAPAASDVATRLRDAGFVRLVAARSGDAVAATGLLVSALQREDVPSQSSVVAMPDDPKRATDADLTIALGRPSTRADLTVGVGSTPASRTAFEVATQLAAPDNLDRSALTLALAGVCAAGSHPDGELLAAAEADGIERRPGVGVPTDDLTDGLAHSLSIHAPFSGSVAAAAQTLDGLELPDTLDEDARRRVASTVALAVAGDTEATSRATECVERVLRPYTGSRFGTIAGFADVLSGTVHERPGLAIPLALDAIEAEAALDAWRAHASRAHEAVREVRTGRYDGLFVARCSGDAPVDTVARLVRDFRSPEPLVLVVADGRAAATAGDAEANVGTTIQEVAAKVGGTGTGTTTRGRAQFDVDATEFVVAFREAV